MKTIHVSRRKVAFAMLAFIALLGVTFIVIDVVSWSTRDRANVEAGAVAADPPPHTDDALTEAQIEEATSAAGHALAEVMRLDHTEGREAWEARIAPLCTLDGLAFWTGPLFAGQVWPLVTERAYVTQEVNVVSANIVDEDSASGAVTVEVTLTTTYTQSESDDPVEETSTNQVVMVKNPDLRSGFFQGKSPDGLFPVQRDGRWLVDGPPAQ